MALLELAEVSAGYGPIQILHGVSLHVNEGEVVAVIGPNGAGKSTTFKVIMGFISYLGGRMTFDGHDLVGQRPDRILGLGLGYVPQGRVVFTQMTVRENLEMGAFLERDKAKIRKAMEWVFALFPRLAERTKQQAGTLSGGEQQMLAMGRALMMRPKMLMLDEPSLGLSPRLVDEVFDKTVEMARAGLTVMLVEQNAARALEISDRGYVLELGRNRFEGRGATCWSTKRSGGSTWVARPPARRRRRHDHVRRGRGHLRAVGPSGSCDSRHCHAERHATEVDMAATVREALRELMTQTMTTMDALLEASDRELTMPSSHACAQGKDLWTLLTNDIDHEKIHTGQILEGRYESQITASRMHRLLAEWLEERARLIGSLIGLTDEQFNRETAPGQWTYRVVAKHVLTLEQDSLRTIAADQASRATASPGG
jgi:branched-chain amino acid transport system ATP-binding protein